MLYLRTLLAEVPLDRLAADGPVLTSPPLTAAIQDVLHGLPSDSCALVEALAVLATRVPLQVAAGLAGLTEPGATAALDPLLRGRP